MARGIRSGYCSNSHVLICVINLLRKFVGPEYIGADNNICLQESTWLWRGSVSEAREGGRSAAGRKSTTRQRQWKEEEREGTRLGNVEVRRLVMFESPRLLLRRFMPSVPGRQEAANFSGEVP